MAASPSKTLRAVSPPVRAFLATLSSAGLDVATTSLLRIGIVPTAEAASRAIAPFRSNPMNVARRDLTNRDLEVGDEVSTPGAVDRDKKGDSCVN